MSGKKHQTVEPASEQSTPASAVPETESAPAGSSESAPAPKKVQALKSNGGGGRKVLATAHINRAGGNIKPGDEFELADEKEASRLAGCYKDS